MIPRSVVLLLLVLTHGACAPARISPPPDPSHVNARAFSGTYDEVWELVVDWFAEGNIPIHQIEKASGLIASEHALGADASMLDCGRVEAGDSQLMEAERTANVNVRVRESAGDVRVQVDVFGRGRFTFFNAMLSVRTVLEAPRCVSTGEVESALFRHVEAGVGG